MMSTKGVALTILLFTSTSTFSQNLNVAQFCSDYNFLTEQSNQRYQQVRAGKQPPFLSDYEISIRIKMQGYVKQYGWLQVAELAMTCK